MPSLPRSWSMFRRLALWWRPRRAGGASRARRPRLAGLTNAVEGLEQRSLLAADSVGFDPGDVLTSMDVVGGTYVSGAFGAGTSIASPACAAIGASRSIGGSAFAVDVEPPVVSIGSPDTPNVGVSHVRVATSEPVTGLGVEDFALTRDGAAVRLDGAMLLPSWQPGTYDLFWSGTGTSAGTYELRFHAAGSGVADAAGNAADGDAVAAWTVVPPIRFATGPRAWAGVLERGGIGGGFGFVDATAAVPAADGGTFLAGSLQGSASFDPATGGGMQSSMSQGGFVARYDAAGSLAEFVPFGGTSGMVRIDGLAVRADGAVAVIGAYDTYGGDPVDLDPSGATFDATGAGGFVALIDPTTRAPLWIRTLTGNDASSTVAFRGDGAVVIAARSYSSPVAIGGEGSYAGSESPVSMPSGHGFIAAFAATGGLSWCRDLGDSVGIEGLATDGADTFVAGSMYDAIQMVMRGFLAKYDAAGSVAWSAASLDDDVPAIAVDTGGTIVAASNDSTAGTARLTRLSAADGSVVEIVRTFLPDTPGNRFGVGIVAIDSTGGLRAWGLETAGGFGVTGGTLRAIKLAASAGDDGVASFTVPGIPRGWATAEGGAAFAIAPLGSGFAWEVPTGPGGSSSVVASTLPSRIVARLTDPFAAEPPAASFAPVASPRKAAFDTAVLTFTEAVDGVDAGDFILHRDGAVVPLPLRFRVDSSDGVTFTITGLADALDRDAAYTLALRAAGSGIVTRAGGVPLPGSNDPRLSFVVDATPPAATLSLLAPGSNPVDAALIVLSEPVTGLDTADFRLDGRPLPAGAALAPTYDPREFSLTGLAAGAPGAGGHALTLVAASSGIEDAAGNTLAADASLSWTNAAPPDLQVTALAVSPASPTAGDTLTISWNDANTGAGDARGGWLDRVAVVNATTGQTIVDTVLWNAVAVATGDAVARQFTFVLPAGMAGIGELQITVTADTYGQCSEDNPFGTAETNNTASLTVQALPPAAPDLVVSGLRVTPPAIQSGALVTVEWNDDNVGTATATGYQSWGGAYWYDRVRVTNTTTGQVLVDTSLVNWNPIAAGGTLARQYSFTLPDGMAGVGDLQITVTTDDYGGFWHVVTEFNASGTAETNNSATITVPSTIADYPDLVVEGLAVSPGVLASGGLVTINWTDTNAGTAAVNYWLYDRVRVVNTTTGQTLVDQVPFQYVSLAAGGGSAARSYSFTLPEGVAGAGSLAITVTADFYSLIVESNAAGTAETNNSATVAVMSTLRDYPDLVVRDLAIDPQTLQSSHTFVATWNEQNIGRGAASGRWSDRVLVVNTTTGQTLVDTSVPSGGLIAPNGSQSNFFAYTLPDAQAGAGQIRVSVTIDGIDLYQTGHGMVYEFQSDGTGETNNEASAVATSTVPDYPDLTVTGLAFDPPALESGSPVTVRWNDANVGSGPTYRPYLDSVRIFNRTTGQLIGSGVVSSGTPIPAGGTAARSYSFTLPEDAPGVGSIEVTVTADRDSFGDGMLCESNADGTAELNNAATITATSTLVLCPDLVVSAVVSPARGFSGRDAQITWTITNQGTADFSGSLRDALFLAASPTAISARYALGDFEALLSLPVGGSVTRTQQVTLPVGREGAWYVGVITDVFNAAHEHGGENNNLSFASAPIVLQSPPIPNLVVGSVTAPPTALSSDQTVVAWTVTNTGTGPTNAPIWYDRVYLSADDVLDSTDLLLGRQQNQSYLAPGESYASSLAVTLPTGINGPYRFIVATDVTEVVFEGANEGDNWRAAESTAVQLTPPPDLQVASVRGPMQAFSGQPIQVSWTVTNAGAGRTLETAWDDQVFLSSDDTFDGSDVFLGSYRHSGILVAGDSYTASGTVTLPVGVSGNSYLFVFTDANREVFQHVFVNNDVGHSAALNVLLTPPPDLVVSAVKAPASAEAGRGLAINYTVTNDGATKTPDGSGSWTDRVYLSADRTLDAGDLPLIERLHDSWLGLGPGSSYSESFNAPLPATLTGTYYVIVQADAGGRVFELDRGNNVGVTAVPVAVTFQPADLVVQPGSVTAPATASAGGSMQVGFTVRNAGSGATVATAWRDRVVLSSDSVLGNGDDLLLDTVIHTGGLAAGAAYTARAVPVQIPLSVATGGYTLFVVADGNDEVFEYPAGAEANNASAGLPITISRTTADLQVSAVSLDKATVTSGDTLTVGWTVTNAGAAATAAESWFDRVVLQPVGAGPAIELGTFQHNDPLAGGGSYAVSRTLAVPADIQGSYRVVVTTDYGDRVIEGSGETNNDGVPQPLDVAARPLPNLVVTDVSAPADAFAGQLITVSWTVANVGSAMATGRMFDVVFLSLDQTLDSGDLPIGYGSGDATISAGGHYTLTTQLRLPQGVTGAFHLIVATDAAAQVRESDETDNSRCDIDPTVVTLMPPADLVVGTITVPATGVPGSTLSIAYTVRNDGVNPADGSWRDSLYLSTDDTWDVQDVLLGSVDVAATVPGNGGSYTRTLDAPAPGVNPGSYRVIVRSDIRNTLPEQSETNNLAASLDSVAFDVAGLDLATTATGTLAAGASAYYKVVVPSDGQTLRFTFDSLAVAGAAQVFVRHGAMPSPNKFDAASTSPFDAHQTLTAPADRAGTYYVLVTSRSGSGGYSLRADLVPFAVTAADSSAGGNRGEFTIKVSGSKFQQGTDFELVSAAGTEFMAVRKVVQDSVTAYVTFDMTSAAPGGYTLRAINGATVANLAAPFFVQASVGPDVVLGLVAPDAVRDGALVSVQVNYANRGNQDTLAPLILVESVSGLPIGLSNSAMVTSAPLQILGVSPDGPLGTLRPGSLGSANVSCFTGGQDGPAPQVQVSRVTSTAKGVITADDWTMIERSVRPAGVTDATWSIFWSRISPRMGTTWGDYVRFLNRVLDAVAEPGARNQDVRGLINRLIETRPGYLPSLSATGRLLSSTSGAAIAGLPVAAYHDVGGRQTRAASSTTGADGGFRFDGLQPGTYAVAVGDGYSIDQDRNGMADYPSFTFTVVPDTDLTDLVVHVVPESTAAAPAAVDSSALAVDPLGRTHIVYSYGGKIWQSTFDGTGWGPSSVIANESGTSLTLRAAAHVIGGVGAGFVATWSTGSGNDAEIHWSAGRPTTGGGYIWTTTASLTSNTVVDATPVAAVLPDGRVVVAYDRWNAAIQDDSDLYYDVMTVDPAAFPAASSPITTADSGTGTTVPLWTREVKLKVAKMKLQVSQQAGTAVVDSGCQFTRTGSGDVTFEAPIRGDLLKLTGGGTVGFSETYGVNLLNQSWGLLNSQVTVGAKFVIDAPKGLLYFMELIPPLSPAAWTAGRAISAIEWITGLEIQPGIKIGANITGTSVWDAYTPVLGWEGPDTSSTTMAATLTPYLAVKAGDASVSVSGSIEVKAQVLPEFSFQQLTGSLTFTAAYKDWEKQFSVSAAHTFAFDVSAPGFADAIQPLDATVPDIEWVYTPSAAIGTGGVYGANSVIADVSADRSDDGPPAIASTSTGAFAAWAKRRTDAIGDDVIVSEFDGARWTTPVPLPGSFGLDGGVAAAVDGGGSRFVLWTRSDATLTPSSSSAEVEAARIANDVWYAVSTGGAWSGPMRLAATAGTDGNITATTLGDGSVIVAWTERHADGSCDLWTARWQAGAWQTPFQVTSGLFVSQVVISEHAGNPFICWTERTDTPGASQSFMNYAILTGTGWTTPEVFTPGASTPQAVAAAVTGGAPEPTDAADLWLVGLPQIPQDCLKHCEKPPAPDAWLPPQLQWMPHFEFDPYTCDWKFQWSPKKHTVHDPNDLVAPEGFGADHWINAGGAIPYEIRFENAPVATAPVQTLTIRQKLDPDLKPSTFRLGSFGFRGMTFDVPADSPFYSTRLDLMSTLGCDVDVVAGIDVASGEAFWTFTAVDPATGDKPLDPFVGFLPPDDATGHGNGFVNYTIRPRADLPTGTRLDAAAVDGAGDYRAAIVFDTNAPMFTPAVFNTLDAAAPRSAVQSITAVPAQPGDDGQTPSFTVDWAGTDAESDGRQGSGVASYTVYVSIDGGGFTRWLTDTSLRSSAYVGEPGHTYAFYSLATDNAGNVESRAAGADATYTTPGGVATIGDLVWHDANGNGIQDAGETGLAGVTVTLHAIAAGTGADTVVGTPVTTGTDGRYTFTNVPVDGQYYVVFSAPAGYAFSQPNAAADDALDSNADASTGQTAAFAVHAGDNPTWDAGLFRLGSIAGTLWNDVDGDRVRTAGEPALAGWTVYIDADDNGRYDAGTDTAAVTDSQGRYTFPGLRPGNFVVSIVLQPGWVETTPGAAGSNSAGAVGLQRTYTFSGSTADLVAPGGVEANAALSTTDCGCHRTTAGTSTATVGIPATGTTYQPWADLIQVDAYRADPRFAGIDGRGQTIVFLDTGIDVNHPFFGGDANGDGIDDRIVYQWDFADRDPDASDRAGHGSHVASVAASQDSRYVGVAPGASIIELKVFGDDGRGSFASVEQALEWVIQNAARFNVVAVNMSLGDAQNWTGPLSSYGIGDELSTLAGMNVITVAAAGNNYALAGAPGMAYPAADPNVISVGAVWDGDRGGPWSFGNLGTDYTTGADRIVSFSQRDASTDIFAVGAVVGGANATGGTAWLRGTSMAAPQVTGAAALAQQIAVAHLGRRLSLAELRYLLKSSGTTIVDGDDENDSVRNTGLTYRRLDVQALASAVVAYDGTLPASFPAGPGAATGSGDAATGTQTGRPLSYTIQLAAEETRSNADFGVRYSPPEVADVVDIAPDPRNTGVTSIEFSFTKQIDASTLDVGDITLSGPAGAVDLAGLTLAEIVPGLRYRLGGPGLPILTAAEGTYTVTVRGAHVMSKDGATVIGEASDTWTVDTGPPSILITSDRLSLKAGEKATITFTLSEPATGFTAADVVVTSGTLTGFTGFGTTYVASFTATARFAGVGSVSVAASAFTDAAGNANTAGSLAGGIDVVQGTDDDVVSVPDGRDQTDAGARASGTRLVKRGGGTLILDTANSHTGGTVVEAGSVVVRNTAALGRGEIVVKAGATLVLDVGVDGVSIDSLQIEAGGFIDLGSGRITVAGGLTEQAVRALLHEARGADDAWTGLSGIGSSRASADAAAGRVRGLGWIDDGSGAVTIAYAAPGDVNLDGIIDVVDLAGLLSAEMFDSGEAATWGQGDFNYDGTVDVLDLTEVLAGGLFDHGDYVSETAGMNSGSAAVGPVQEPLSATEAVFAALAADNAATPSRKKVLFGVR